MSGIQFCYHKDKKIIADAARSLFVAKDCSDHMAFVHAHDDSKDAERVGSYYEYCWKNFLSPQTTQVVNSRRKQFSFLLKNAGLVDADSSAYNKLSHNQPLVRAVICASLFPDIVSIVYTERPMTLKTMDEGQIILYTNSVNAREQVLSFTQQRGVAIAGLLGAVRVQGPVSLSQKDLEYIHAALLAVSSKLVSIVSQWAHNSKK